MPVAVIGGSGFHRWEKFKHAENVPVMTPYSPDPVMLLRGTLAGQDVVYLRRHGTDHSVPPHRINYRANIRALKEVQANAVLAIATVGGISAAAPPGTLMIPDQILDYTWGREHTFFDGEDGVVGHAEMSEPYCAALRDRLLEAAAQGGIPVAASGTYAVTQGPRLETPAEIRRLEKDGADVVGMTGMPEAALARELQLAYAAVVVVVNPAAGKSRQAISMEEVRERQASARAGVEELLACVVGLIAGDTFVVPPPLKP